MRDPRWPQRPAGAAGRNGVVWEVRRMVLWWIGNALLLLVVIPAVVALALRVLRPAQEIRRYADEILEHTRGIAHGLDPLPALADTRELGDELARKTKGLAQALEATR
jgi:hypothetical protein